MPDEELHFEITEAAPPGDEELLAAGAPPRHRAVRSGRLSRVPAAAWTAGLVLALLAGLGVREFGAGHDHPAPIAATPTATTTIAPPPVAPTPSADPTDASLDQLIYLAETPHALSNNVRGAGTTPSCPDIPVGDDPVATVNDQVHRLLPQFSFNTSAVTMNADATMCGLDVRYTDPNGAVLIIQITAPPFGFGPPFQASRRNDRSTAVDVATLLAGWRVEVGWAGRTGSQLSYAELLPLARDVNLRW